MSQADDHIKAYFRFDQSELESGNILLVRTGKNVDQRVVRQFFDHAMQTPSFTRF